ncbi:MAG: OB-fold nucleic acid binding domain-containing protein [Thermoleophilaceae bacterium]
MEDDRRGKLERLREEGIDPFPHSYAGVQPAQSIATAHADLEAGDETEVAYRVAGRLTGRREFGKAAFLDVTDRSGKIQIQARKDDLGEESFGRITSLDLGDILGVDGTALRVASRRADPAGERLAPAGQVAACSARQVPRARGHRDPLPPP